MRVHVLCFGNLLAGDDGFGIHVYRRLSERALGQPGVDVGLFDGGLLGMSALGLFEGCERVIVVDALVGEGVEGEVEQLSLRELAVPTAAFNAHALDLTHLFHVLPIVFEGRTAPDVTVIGARIRPPAAAFDMELSEKVAPAVEQAVKLVRRELSLQSHAETAQR